MLQSIRERAQGWIAWAIVILIAIPFALWGIQSYFGGGGEQDVAKVNGQKIPRRELDRQYQNTRIMLRERLGAAYDPALFDDAALRREVLESLIQDTLLLDRAAKMGLRASDEEIRLAIMSSPAFQAEGRFDKDAYERALSIQGLTPARYETLLRQRLVSSQLERAVLASGLVTDAELNEAIRLLAQERDVRFLRIDAAGLDSGEIPGEAEIQAHYEATRSRYEIPEKVKLEYLLLNEESIAAAAPVPSEAALRQRYEVEQARFGKPERRVVRHILVTVPSSATDAEKAQARDTLAKARARIEAGETFAAVAQETSADPESAAKGGLIGEIEQGLMTPAFDQAAFALAEGTVSDPVRTPFGYHLIQVDEVIPADIKPFESVRDQLAEEVRQRDIETLYYDWAERLATMAYEAADTLAPAAEALGLEIQGSGWIPRTGGEGVLANPRVMTAAFSDEVVREGLNSELIEPERGRLQAIVIRVVEHREADSQPLAEVREQVIAALRQVRAQEAAAAQADELLERLEAGASLDDVAGDWTISEVGMIGRTATDLPGAVRTLAFDLPRPAADEASYGQVRLASGDMAIVAVTAVVDGQFADLGADRRAQERDLLSGRIARRYFDEMVADMVSRAKIERYLAPDAAEIDE